MVFCTGYEDNSYLKWRAWRTPVLRVITVKLCSLRGEFDMADNILTMPVVFIGHGSPTLILRDNRYTRAWRALAASLPRPKSIVVISAHWLTTGKTLVTAMQQPRTIHDFGRMDARLFEIEYPAPGAPELAQWIAQQISHTRIVLDETWGLDHGAWCPLSVMYPLSS